MRDRALFAVILLLISTGGEALSAVPEAGGAPSQSKRSNGAARTLASGINLGGSSENGQARRNIGRIGGTPTVQRGAHAVGGDTKSRSGRIDGKDFPAAVEGNQ